MSFKKIETRLWSWGKNYLTQLGLNEQSPYTDSSITSFPVQTCAINGNWKSISLSSRRDATNGSTAGIKTDGTLWCWGNNSSGQLGDNTTTQRRSPVQIYGGGATWKQVTMQGSTGTREHAAAVKTDGTLWCWGNNSFGQLGDGTLISKSSPVQTVAAGSNWKIAAFAHAQQMFALKTDNTLWAWGTGINQNIVSSPVQLFAGETNWKQIAPGYVHAIGLKTDGSVWGFGDNTNGAIGNNSTNFNGNYAQESTLSTTWKQVSAGGYGQSFGIKNDGSLWAWGYGANGTLGLGNNTPNVLTPTRIGTGNTWEHVSSDYYLAFALKTDGTLWSWGLDCLGAGNTLTSSSPVQIVGSNWIVAVDYENEGPYETTLGITKDILDETTINGIRNNLVTKERLFDLYPSLGSHITDAGLWICGYNSSGQIGDGTITNRSSPIQLSGSNWKIMNSNGAASVAGVKTDGTLWMWGMNHQGQLGDNTKTYRSSPVQTISAGTNWKQASIGPVHFSGIKQDGTLWSCGYNGDGELGDNTTASKSSPVQTISAGTNWKQVSVAANGSTATKTDGSLWCWGRGLYGQLGNTSSMASVSPVQTVSAGTDWKIVSCGGTYNAAVKTGGTLWLWGYNANGQLGDNSTTMKSSPVQTVAGGNDWKTVSSGYQFVSAIKVDGSLWTWGYNVQGQLGDGTTTNRSSPMQVVTGGSNWKQVSNGTSHVVALKTDGSMWAWGSNSFGQVDLTAPIFKSSPVMVSAAGGTWRQVVASSNLTIAIKEGNLVL
jgi:alpha-tubulin suppressor-like RCC1 family protein